MNRYELVRLFAFIFTLLACALAERLAPRRARVAADGPRWFANLSLAVIGGLCARVLIPFTAIAAAYRAEAARVGLLNQASIPFAIKFVLTVLLLDLLIYWQHRLFHTVPALWRLHAVHHTDLDLDASSGVRFHPGEILLSAVIKGTGVALLGGHFLGVAAFEVILSSTALFHHANIHLPGPLDSLLRWITITPDMHRVHHSPQPRGNRF